MTAVRPFSSRWSAAAAIAVAVHLGAVALVSGLAPEREPAVPEPVVLIELPPEAAPVPAPVAAVQQMTPQPQVVPQNVLTPPIDVPLVKAPLPKAVVTLPPPPPPLPIARATPAPAATPPAPNAIAVTKQGAGTGTSATPGNDPKAKRQEADYFSLVSAHLNRKKIYPADAKKARQQGVVTVRFTVDRRGNVSAESIKRGSGHALLDQATIDLVRRVSPLPPMPASMQRDTVTLSLAIDYTLSSK